ncbi:MAG: M23 family metallopeptidase, partial [Janthinobacterium lividum]
ANKLFLTKFKNRFKGVITLENRAKIKIASLKDLMLKLNTRYNFLSSRELNNFKAGGSSYSNIRELAHLDRIASNLPIMMPAYIPVITSHYGIRKHPINKKRIKFHTGIDMASRKASAIYASADGIVCKVERMKGYGNTVEVKHFGSFKTKYAHLKKIDVFEGEKIVRGQKIGTQGNTGQATSEHLHYEIWLGNRHLNPFDFIAHACKC